MNVYYDEFKRFRKNDEEKITKQNMKFWLSKKTNRKTVQKMRKYDHEVPASRSDVFILIPSFFDLLWGDIWTKKWSTAM